MQSSHGKQPSVVERSVVGLNSSHDTEPLAIKARRDLAVTERASGSASRLAHGPDAATPHIRDATEAGQYQIALRGASGDVSVAGRLVSEFAHPSEDEEKPVLLALLIQVKTGKNERPGEAVDRLEGQFRIVYDTLRASTAKTHSDVLLLPILV